VHVHDDDAVLDNSEIADRLDALAAMLELGDANRYTIRAYRRAAETIRDCGLPVAELVAAGRGRELRGIGPGIDARLRELVDSGQIAELVELERELRPDLVGLDRYRRRGPEPAGLWLSRAQELVGGVARALGAEPAGDVRRWRDSCQRLAVVGSASAPERVLAQFAALPQIVAVLERGPRHAVGVTVDGIPVELTVAEPAAFGTALVRATGSSQYVAALEPLPNGPDEHAVYASLGVSWCPPELRELPFAGEPPSLVEIGQIRGDLHCHTTYSDGRASVLDMARAALARGYEYLAVCDHTPAVGAVRGLSVDDVKRQGDEIAAVNAALAPFRVLHGIECDILGDGGLDLPDDVLAELDWVQASVHGGQRMPRAEMTERVEQALLHPSVRCLSHPTGRLINRRPENALDLERVFEVARNRGIALEVNGLPARLDLSGEHVREALRAGIHVVCSTDAHSPAGLDHMALSVATARRGWATAADVLNTRPLDALLRRS
jgi:DNA polymerase (family 10)